MLIYRKWTELVPFLFRVKSKRLAQKGKKKSTFYSFIISLINKQSPVDFLNLRLTPSCLRLCPSVLAGLPDRLCDREGSQLTSPWYDFTSPPVLLWIQNFQLLFQPSSQHTGYNNCWRPTDRTLQEWTLKDQSPLQWHQFPVLHFQITNKQETNRITVLQYTVLHIQ